MSKLKFLLCSGWGDLHGLGRLLVHEGHDVRLYTYHPEASQVGRGLVDRAPSRIPQKGEIVLFDESGHGTEGTRWRAMGHPVIGGNPIDVDLELKRGKAMTLLEKQGLTIPETKRFRTFGEAKSFLERQDDDAEWYFKAEGNKSTALTLGGRAELLLRFLAWAKGSAAGKEITEFILQAKVSGAEVSTEGWFDGTRFVLPFNGTIEEKGLLPGEGPKTGCQTNVVWTYAEDEPVLPEQTVGQLADYLAEHEFVGPIDVNAIVDRKGVPHALELSPRFGFDALPAYVSLLAPGTVGEQLAAFAEGDLPEWDVDPRVLAVTLRVSVPPYPTEDPKRATEMRGFPLDDTLLDRPDRVFLDDVMLGDDDHAVCAGRDGNLAVLVTVGTDLEELTTELVEHAERLDIPEKQFLEDPLETAAERLRALKSCGAILSTPPALPVDQTGSNGAKDNGGEEEAKDGAEEPRRMGATR